MHIRCPKCGEPWELDSLHDEVSARIESGAFRRLTEPKSYAAADASYKRYQKAYGAYFDTVRDEFTRKGCSALTSFGSTCSYTVAHPGTSAIYDLVGDDIDGAASLLDDFAYLGLLD